MAGEVDQDLPADQSLLSVEVKGGLKKLAPSAKILRAGEEKAADVPQRTEVKEISGLHIGGGQIRGRQGQQDTAVFTGMVNRKENKGIADKAEAWSDLGRVGKPKFVVTISVEGNDDIPGRTALGTDQTVEVLGVGIADDACNGGSRVIHTADSGSGDVDGADVLQGRLLSPRLRHGWTW